MCSGVITDKNILPVTRLNFGRTQLATSSGIHTLGRLVCSGSVAINGFPTSCEDLWLIGHTLNGFYSIKGEKMIESAYCDFTQVPGHASKFILKKTISLSLISFNDFLKRFPEMDRIRRRQIDARPFLRPAKFFVFHTFHSNSVRIGGGERGQCHGFDNREIYGTTTGNLFFRIRGSGDFSSFIIFISIWSFSLFERKSNRDWTC